MARQAGRNERRRGRCGRIVGRREVRQRFLIVCEGEKTEPGYFRSFQVPGVVVDIHSTTGRLYAQYSPWDPATADPSTTVHLLVEELNKHRRP
jgi:hypothetical protein